MKKLLIALLTLMLGTTPALAAEIPGLVWESSMEKTYATEFNVDYFEGGYALIEVIDSASYLVVPEGMPVPESLDGSIRVLRQPLDRIYLQATSGMALIDRLDALDSIRLVGTRQNGWYVDNAVPVSYTHLDVYKRQRLHYAIVSRELPYQPDEQ